MSVDERDLSTLLSSATLVLVGQLLYSMSTLGERLVIARFLDPEAFGEVSIALAILTLATTTSLLGLSQGVPRFVSRFDEKRDVRGTWATGLAIAGSVGVLVTAVLLLEGDHLANLLLEGTDSPALLALFALALPFAIGIQIGVGAIRGLENTIYRTYTRDLLYPGLRLTVLVGFLLSGAGVLAAGYAYIVAASVTFVVVHLLLNRLVPLVGTVRTHSRDLLVFSIPLVLTTILSRLLTRTDTLMLGYFRPSHEVGLYAAAYPLASALVLFLSSFGFMYLPVASRLDADGKREEIDAIYKLTTKWIFILTFPAFLTVVVFGDDVLAILFGPSYTPASTALAILAVGFFTRAAFGRNRETVSALGFTTYLLVTNVFAFGLNIGLNVLLIPRYGPNGAAVASAVSYVGLNLAVFAFLDRRFGISPFSTWTLRTIVVLPISLFPPALLLARYVDLTLPTLVGFAVVAEMAAIGVATVTGCLQPEDEIPLSFVENRLGVKIPLIRRYVPSSS